MSCKSWNDTLRFRVIHIHVCTHACSTFEETSLTRRGCKCPVEISFSVENDSLCDFLYHSHPASLLKPSPPRKPPITSCTILLWSRAVETCKQTSAKAAPPHSLDSNKSSRDSRPGVRTLAWCLSDYTVLVQPPELSLTVSFLRSDSQSDALIRFGERGEESSISIQTLLLSLHHSNFFQYLSLHIPSSFRSLSNNNTSLRCWSNKPGPPFFLLTSPLVRTKPIKG